MRPNNRLSRREREAAQRFINQIYEEARRRVLGYPTVDMDHREHPDSAAGREGNQEDEQ